MKHLFILIQFLCIALIAFMFTFIALDFWLVLQIFSIILGVWAIRSVGDNNWSVYPIPNKESSISSTGAYRYIRHPMYTAIIFFFLPIIFRSNIWLSWLIYGVLVITLIAKVFYEEKQIIDKHPDYKDYKITTKKRLIPFIW